MRVLTYLPALEARGGVELHLLEFTREMASRGHAIDLLYDQDGDIGDEFRSFCASVSPSGSITYGSLPPRDLPRILSAMRSVPTAPDVIYLNNFSELMFGGVLRMRTHAPIVCHLHAFEPFSPISVRFFSRYVQTFVTATDFMRSRWRASGIRSRPIEVVPCGVDPAEYPPAGPDRLIQARDALGIPRDAYVVLYAGRIVPEKGIEVLLHAWRQLNLAAEDARLLIVGVPPEGRDQNADTYVGELRSSGTGAIEWLAMRRDITEFLHAADVLVLPSTWDEAFGRVVIETMLTGRPAIASRVGGVPEILTGEFQTLLFERGDAAGLAARLQQLRHWRSEDPTLGQRCSAYVMDRYQLSDTAGELEALLMRAV